MKLLVLFVLCASALCVPINDNEILSIDDLQKVLEANPEENDILADVTKDIPSPEIESLSNLEVDKPLNESAPIDELSTLIETPKVDGIVPEGVEGSLGNLGSELGSPSITEGEGIVFDPYEPSKIEAAVEAIEEILHAEELANEDIPKSIEPELKTFEIEPTPAEKMQPPTPQTNMSEVSSQQFDNEKDTPTINDEQNTEEPQNEFDYDYSPQDNLHAYHSQDPMPGEYHEGDPFGKDPMEQQSIFHPDGEFGHPLEDPFFNRDYDYPDHYVRNNPDLLKDNPIMSPEDTLPLHPELMMDNPSFGTNNDEVNSNPIMSPVDTLPLHPELMMDDDSRGTNLEDIDVALSASDSQDVDDKASSMFPKDTLSLPEDPMDNPLTKIQSPSSDDISAQDDTQQETVFDINQELPKQSNSQMLADQSTVISPEEMALITIQQSSEKLDFIPVSEHSEDSQNVNQLQVPTENAQSEYSPLSPPELHMNDYQPLYYKNQNEIPLHNSDDRVDYAYIPDDDLFSLNDQTSPVSYESAMNYNERTDDLNYNANRRFNPYMDNSYDYYPGMRNLNNYNPYNFNNKFGRFSRQQVIPDIYQQMREYGYDSVGNLLPYLLDSNSMRFENNENNLENLNSDKIADDTVRNTNENEMKILESNVYANDRTYFQNKDEEYSKQEKSLDQSPNLNFAPMAEVISYDKQMPLVRVPLSNSRDDMYDFKDKRNPDDISPLVYDIIMRSLGMYPETRSNNYFEKSIMRRAPIIIVVDSDSRGEPSEINNMDDEKKMMENNVDGNTMTNNYISDEGLLLTEYPHNVQIPYAPLYHPALYLSPHHYNLDNSPSPSYDSKPDNYYYDLTDYYPESSEKLSSPPEEYYGNSYYNYFDRRRSPYGNSLNRYTPNDRSFYKSEMYNRHPINYFNQY